MPIRPTQRAIAILLMCLLPLQYSWAMASVHAHPGDADGAAFLHFGGHPAGDAAGSGGGSDAGQPDGDQGLHHCHHCQQLPSLLILDSGVPAGSAPAGRPEPAAARDHASHIPPLHDRPPQDLACA